MRRATGGWRTPSSPPLAGSGGDPGRGRKCGQGRGRTADLSLFRRALVPTELPAPAGDEHRAATLTGLEPATSAVTGRRANQLRYRALLVLHGAACVAWSVPPTGFEPVLPP